MRIFIACSYPASSSSQPFLPGSYDLLDGLRQGLGDIPLRVMRFHLAQIAVITDMVSDPVLIDIGICLLSAGEGRRDIECLQYGTGVPLAAPQVVYLASAGVPVEFKNKSGDVLGMDVVPHLFSFIPEDPVFSPLQIAFDEITEKAVQFDP
jgi:hypothetical protein